MLMNKEQVESAIEKIHEYEIDEWDPDDCWYIHRGTLVLLYEDHHHQIPPDANGMYLFPIDKFTQALNS